mgnify:CR=1 FL=1
MLGRLLERPVGIDALAFQRLAAAMAGLLLLLVLSLKPSGLFGVATIKKV